MIEIVDTGPLALIQDRGRPGYAALGVPRSGAFDRAAAALANRLVGNRADAALLEVTFGGLCLRALDAVTVAVTGAPCPGADWGVAISLAAGGELRLAAPTSGLRSYVALRGGVAAPVTLGSRSTDLLSRLGPAALSPGDVLAIGPAPDDPPSGAVGVSPRSSENVFHVLDGPRLDWFTPDAVALLTGTTWTVRADSDRIGIRLDGPPLHRTHGGELPSEPTRPGALQVPADGRPIVFGPDAPVTGGYPVLAVLREADLDLAAQLRPGDGLRLAWVRTS